MSWLSKAFHSVDTFANKINPMHHFMDQAANVMGDVWKPLGKAGHWGNDHPAEAAAIAGGGLASAYFGGAALAGGFGGAAGEAGAGSAIGTTAAKDIFKTLKGSGGGMAGVSGGGDSGVDWSSVIGGLGSLYSGVQSNSQAGGLQSILNNAYGFNASRPEYTKELNDLMANPEQGVLNSPGYKAKMDQALQASERTAAAQGLTGSGTEAAALAQTGANLESSTYDQLFQQLSMLSGATLDPSHLFSGQMSVDQTKQNGSGGVFSGLSSAIGGANSASGGGLGSWFSNLFSSGGGGGSSAVGDAVGGSGGADMSMFAELGG